MPACQQRRKTGGSEDSRYIWPDILRIIREVGPGLVLLENVRGLLSLGFGGILKDLAGAGYDAEWGMFSA
jgi:DNA (cytosine-5)-methyltransferase 1